MEGNVKSNVKGDLLLGKLAGIVGLKKVSNNPEVLDLYSHDHTFTPPRKPNFVVWPTNVEEVQAIVKLANEETLPLIPRSSGVGFTGGTIPNQGGVVVDMSKMKEIVEIDLRNRKARIEPGVTFGQLQASLFPQGLMALNPLLPHASKSVLSSHLEREPMLIPKFEYGDPVLTMEIVLPTGDIFRTGSASAPGAPDDTLADLVGPYGPGLDFHRILQGAQGTLGIITWMTIKVEYLPQVQKLFFIPSNNIEELIEPTYRIQRKMLGSECFILNNSYLASILAKDGEIEKLKEHMPSWTMIICIAGGPRRPEEKIEYEEEALTEIGAEFVLHISQTLPGAPGQEKIIAHRLRQSWPEEVPYWKLRTKGGCSVLSFHTLLERVPDITQAAHDFLACAGYAVEDMGCYVQPLERARACFCEYGLSYDPENTEELKVLRNLHADLSEFLFDRGVLFTRPYGAQAEMVFGRATAYTNTLRDLKKIFDPKNIMNPGKLCF